MNARRGFFADPDPEPTPEPGPTPSVRTLTVHVSAQIDDGEVLAHSSITQIPPAYDSMDVRALTARRIEDTAFQLLQERFGRQPTKAALLAYVARIRGIQEILDGPDGIVPRELRIRAVIALSNSEAIEAYGEETEGH